MIRRIALLVALLALTAGLTLGAPAGVNAGMPTIGGEWSAIPEIPAPAAVMTATGGADGRLYVFGFCEGTCPQTGGNSAYGDPVTYIHDPADGDWHPGRPAPKSCAGAMASTLGVDGLIRLAGCWKDMVTDPGFRVAVYDPVANTWTREPGYGPYVDPIAGMTGDDGRIFWFSETLRIDGSAVFVSGNRVVVERPDGTWNVRAKMPSNSASDGAALGSDGVAYVAGGSRQCHPQFGACTMPPVAAWTPWTNAWTRPTVLPTSRIRIAVTADALGRIFTIGGVSADGSRLFSRVEVYRPDKGTWARAAKLPYPRFAATAAFTPDGRVWLIGGYDGYGSPLYDGYVFTPTS